MKKDLIWVLVALTLFQLTSCTQDADNLMSEKRQAKREVVIDDGDNLDELLAISSSPQRSKEEALAIAQHFLKASTRSIAVEKPCCSNDFDVDYILADKSSQTYSRSFEQVASVDTLLYVLNRKDGQGFFIISGDKRVPDLLAHSLKGSLDLDKDNLDITSGFAVFLSRLPAYYQSVIDGFHARIDSIVSLKPEFGDGHFEDYERIRKPQYKYEYSDWEEVSRTPNLVPVKWGQGSPYNDQAVIIDGKRAFAGCVAVATAQLISSFKYPSSYKGVSLDWNLLTKYSFYESEGYTADERIEYAKQVALLLRKIGDKLGNNWGTSATGANTKTVPGLLRDMGYQHVQGLTSFNANDVISSISQKKAVILDGFAESYKKGWLIFKKQVYNHGHAWISDGYLKQERTIKKISLITNKVLETKTESRILLHCNWGWSGYCDGYFLSGVFDSHNSVIRDPQETRSADSYIPYYYQYEIRNMLYTHP